MHLPVFFFILLIMVITYRSIMLSIVGVQIGLLVGCATIADRQATLESSLLWRVTSPDGVESYLFGTIHLAHDNVFQQRDSVLILMRRCTEFRAELHLDSMKLAALVTPDLFFYTDGRTLKDFYSDSEYEEIMSVLREQLGPMATMADRMKPFVAAVTLALADVKSEMEGTSIDEFLWRVAGRMKLNRGGVERVAEQFALLDSMPPELLLETVRNVGKNREMIKTIVEIYATENLVEAAKVLTEFEADTEFSKSVVDRRNKIMADRLDELYRLKPTFAAVGTLHLVGANGLIALLRARGFQVSPVIGGKRVDLKSYSKSSQGE